MANSGPKFDISLQKMERRARTDVSQSWAMHLFVSTNLARLVSWKQLVLLDHSVDPIEEGCVHKLERRQIRLSSQSDTLNISHIR